MNFDGERSKRERPLPIHFPETGDDSVLVAIVVVGVLLAGAIGWLLVALKV